MGVVFNKKKDGWVVQYFDAAGKRHREFIGPKRLTQSVYRKRKTEIREGKFFPESLHAHKVTVAEAIDEYLKKSEKRLKHFRHYKRLGRYWKEELGVKPLACVMPGDVKSYIAKRMDRFSPASINRQLAFLKKVFSDCVLDGIVQTNPVKSVRMLTENNARTRSLSYEEERRLLEALPERYRDAVLFAVNTGLRQTEQFQLRRTDVVEGVARIAESKSGKARFVPLNSVASRIVDSATAELVFPFNAHNFYNRVFQPALKRAGIADLRWHDLRHTFASRLVQRGVPLYTVQRLLGHQSIQMTERYAHLAPDDLLAAVTKLSATSAATNPSQVRAPASVERERNLHDDRRGSLMAAVGIEPTT